MRNHWGRRDLGQCRKIGRIGEHECRHDRCIKVDPDPSLSSPLRDGLYKRLHSKPCFAEGHGQQQSSWTSVR
jgi:hypothetical protein